MNKLTSDELSNEVQLTSILVLLRLVYGVEVKIDETLEWLSRDIDSVQYYQDPEFFNRDQPCTATQAAKKLDALKRELHVLKNILRARMKYTAYGDIPRPTDPYIKIHSKRFRFPNTHVYHRECLDAAFRQNGMEIADVQRVSYMWTYVLTTGGEMWIHDMSHGGGGDFSLDSPAKT